MNRRDFLKACALGGSCLLFGKAVRADAGASRAPKELQDSGIFYLKEAMFYEPLEHKRVKCTLCPNECEVGDQERGYCGVRENRGGKYYTLVYGNPCSFNVDPIEKKPLFHFYPGSWAVSLATAGCNISCKFCQNWQISQARPEQTENRELPPAKLVEIAKEPFPAWVRAVNPRKSIAYTYTEPVVFYEYMYDSARLAKEQGIASVMISNGYIVPDAMRKLCEVLAAVKIDLKAITEKFYREVCSGRLKPVLDTLKLLAKSKLWYEIVYLVIPTLNDTPKEFEELSKWIAGELGTDVPLHFTRFSPMYRLQNLPPTPQRTVELAREIAMKQGLRFVYVGNVRVDHPGESTYCPYCSEQIIHRKGFWVGEIRMKDGKCAKCGKPIPGVW